MFLTTIEHFSGQHSDSQDSTPDLALKRGTRIIMLLHMEATTNSVLKRRVLLGPGHFSRCEKWCFIDPEKNVHYSEL